MQVSTQSNLQQVLARRTCAAMKHVMSLAHESLRVPLPRLLLLLKQLSLLLEGTRRTEIGRIPAGSEGWAMGNPGLVQS
jgi:hypothetical protein